VEKFQLRQVGSTKCLIPKDVEADMIVVNNNELGLAECGASLLDLFTVTLKGSIMNLLSGKCIHIYGGATKGDKQLVMYRGCDTKPLKWRVENDTLLNVATDMCALMSSEPTEKARRLVVRKDACMLPQARFERLQA
jgi:hypothetical protein